ncbi:MAG: 50S ribosomal protein L10 [archaeon]
MEDKKIKTYVSEAKKKEVKLLIELINKSPVVGLMDLTGLPSMQFQKLRADLKDIMLIRATKKRLIKIALENVNKPGIAELEKLLENSIPALILSNQDPFKIGKLITKNKSPAAAKVGQISPKNIIIEAGPTPFTPGPMIGELSAVGLKPSVEGGKIVIRQAGTLVKEGEAINAKVADILTKLGIQPMEVGFNLMGIYENGKIYSSDVLNIDESKYINNIKLASGYAFSLALSINYLTKETIEITLAKANSEAISLKLQLKMEENNSAVIEAKPTFSSEEMKEAENKLLEIRDLKINEDKN